MALTSQVPNALELRSIMGSDNTVVLGSTLVISRWLVEEDGFETNQNHQPPDALNSVATPLSPLYSQVSAPAYTAASFIPSVNTRYHSRAPPESA